MHWTCQFERHGDATQIIPVNRKVLIRLDSFVSFVLAFGSLFCAFVVLAMACHDNAKMNDSYIYFIVLFELIGSRTKSVITCATAVFCIFLFCMVILG